MVVDKAFAEVLVLCHHFLGVGGEVVLLDDADGGKDTRHDDDKEDDVYRTFWKPYPLLIGFYCREPEIFHGNESGQGNEDTVDGEQIQGTENDRSFPDGNTIADGAKGWHEGRSDGDT